jgi:hypothetical protein
VPSSSSGRLASLFPFVVLQSVRTLHLTLPYDFGYGRPNYQTINISNLEHLHVHIADNCTEDSFPSVCPIFSNLLPPLQPSIVEFHLDREAPQGEYFEG